MSDELGHLIETGTYSIPGFDANANEPASTQKRPELDDSMFKICKPRYSSKELAIMESELARVQALFGIDPILKKTLQETVQAFDKAHNPSGIPWKEHKRPNEEDIAKAEAGNRGVFLPPCSKETLQELESEGAHIFIHAATPRMNMDFQVIIPRDGSKLYLTCSQDGLFYFPVGRLVGSV